MKLIHLLKFYSIHWLGLLITSEKDKVYKFSLRHGEDFLDAHDGSNREDRGQFNVFGGSREIDSRRGNIIGECVGVGLTWNRWENNNARVTTPFYNALSKKNFHSCNSIEKHSLIKQFLQFIDNASIRSPVCKINHVCLKCSGWIMHQWDLLRWYCFDIKSAQTTISALKVKLHIKLKVRVQQEVIGSVTVEG